MLLVVGTLRDLCLHPLLLKVIAACQHQICGKDLQLVAICSIILSFSFGGEVEGGGVGGRLEPRTKNVKSAKS